MKERIVRENVGFPCVCWDSAGYLSYPGSALVMHKEEGGNS